MPTPRPRPRVRVPQATKPDPQWRARDWIWLGVALAVLVVHIAALRFVCDDAYISFRYADRLAAGDGLVFNRGERVEGYSNFLWVLVCAGLSRAGIAPEAGAPLVSAACALALAVVGYRSLGGAGLAARAFVLLLAASSGYAAWATGGLETALFTLLVFAGFLAAARAAPGDPASGPAGMRPLWVGAVPLLLAALSRPDGLLFAVLTGGFLLVRAGTGRVPWRAWFGWAAVFALPYAGFLLWRRAYFGHWLPNTFAVKSGGLELLPTGLEYLTAVVLRQGLWLLLLPIVGLLWRRARLACGPAPLALGGILTAPYLAYVAAVGGDFMDLGRFVVPLVPIAAWLSAQAIGGIDRAFAERGRRAAGAAVAIALVAAFAAINLRASIETLRPWHRGVDSIGLLRQYRKDWTEVARLIRQVSLPSDTLALTAAGIIPYHTGLYTIDQLGLVAPDLGGYRPRKDVGLPGHKLIASGEWMARLRPQFLLGHPVVVDSLERARPSLMLERDWETRILADYRVVAGQVSLDPPRYFALATRRDVLARRGAGVLGRTGPDAR